MRRIALTLMLPLLAIGCWQCLAGCGGSPAQSAATPAVTVSGPSARPRPITIPSEEGHHQPHGEDRHPRHRARAGQDRCLRAATTPSTSGAAPRTGSRRAASPQHPTLFAYQLLPGLEKALIGQKMGSRVLAVIPPKDAFGSTGNPQAGIKGTDTPRLRGGPDQGLPGRTRPPPASRCPAAAAALPKVTASTERRPCRSRCRRPSRSPSW